MSTGARYIFAEPTTITGSIGIFAAVPTVDRALARLGITVDGVGTTPLSGALRLDRPLDPKAGEFLQTTIEHGYEQFLAHVAQGRNRTRDEVHEIAQGRVWIGSDALRIGLVDQLGGLDEAVKAAAKRAKLGNDYVVERVEPQLSWAQELALQLRIQAARVAGSVLHTPVGALGRLAAPFSPLEQEIARWQRMSTPNHTYAYCSCSVE